MGPLCHSCETPSSSSTCSCPCNNSDWNAYFQLINALHNDFNWKHFVPPCALQRPDVQRSILWKFLSSSSFWPFCSISFEKSKMHTLVYFHSHIWAQSRRWWKRHTLYWRKYKNEEASQSQLLSVSPRRIAAFLVGFMSAYSLVIACHYLWHRSK